MEHPNQNLIFALMKGLQLKTSALESSSSGTLALSFTYLDFADACRSSSL